MQSERIINRHTGGLLFVLFVKMLVLCLLYLGPTKAYAAFVCGQDLNNNGYVGDSGETAQCIAATQGQLCPIGAVDCTPTYSDPTCPAGGSLNTSTDKCEAPPNISCQSGYTYDSAQDICTQPVTCPSNGTLNTTTDMCEAPPPCPQDYTYNSLTGSCEINPPCPSGGSFATTIDKCVIQANYQCTTGYSYSSASKLCEATPACSVGTYDSAQDKCNEGNTTCPAGSQYSCMDNNGINQCSPNQCVDDSTASTSTIDDTMLQDDGPKDGQGSCLGEIYIFQGRGMRCRGSGVSVSFKNCCNESSDSSPYQDSTGAYNQVGDVVTGVKTAYHIGQVAYYTSIALSCSCTPTALSGASQAVIDAVLVGEQAGSVGAGLSSYITTALLNPTTIAIAAVIYLIKELLAKGCDQQDIETSMLDASKRCHYVGEYCEKEWPLVGCAQKAKSFCCFNSKLGRIIHEQGRPQLQSFQTGWGDPKSPNCRGFRPEEFQMIDFSKIDFSEYFGDIQTKAQGEIQQNVTDKIQKFYQNIQ